VLHPQWCAPVVQIQLFSSLRHHAIAASLKVLLEAILDRVRILVLLP
jgi:hypothetical protein